MNFVIYEDETVLDLNGNEINVGGGGATYSCAFSRWVIEDAIEVQMLYPPEITIICRSLI
jgi:hypothetical protein